MKVYLAQLKCPNSHCILALAGEFKSLEDATQALDERVKEQHVTLVAGRILNNECGLCHATQFHVEVAATIFATMEEFTPVARAEEERQLALAARVRQSRN